MSSKAANDCLREGLFDSSKTSATKPSLRGALSSVLTSADSAFQLALEIALGGVSVKVQPLRLIQPCRRYLETVGDVIEDDFYQHSRRCILDFSPMRLGAGKTGTC